MKSFIAPVVVLLTLATCLQAPTAAAGIVELNQQLITAVMSNQAAQVRAAIDAGADVNTDIGDGRTPLIVAVMSTRPDAVRALLWVSTGIARDCTVIWSSIHSVRRRAMR